MLQVARRKVVIDRHGWRCWQGSRRGDERTVAPFAGGGLNTNRLFCKGFIVDGFKARAWTFHGYIVAPCQQKRNLPRSADSLEASCWDGCSRRGGLRYVRKILLLFQYDTPLCYVSSFARRRPNPAYGQVCLLCVQRPLAGSQRSRVQGSLSWQSITCSAVQNILPSQRKCPSGPVRMSQASG